MAPAIGLGQAPPCFRMGRDFTKASHDLFKSQSILEHLPDYCFQTTHEILTMLEQVNENVCCSGVVVSGSRPRWFASYFNNPIPDGLIGQSKFLFFTQVRTSSNSSGVAQGESRIAVTRGFRSMRRLLQ